MIKYGFEENDDYIAITQKRVTAQNNEITMVDHHVKLDMAKEISMIQRTEKGKMARRYFIETEKKYRGLVSQPPTTLESLQAMINQMVEQERRTKQLEQQYQNTNNKVAQIQNHLTESPDRKTIQREINTYARRNEMKIQDVRTMIYNKIEDLHGVDVMQRVANARKKLQDERVEKGKKPYAKSTLEQKINGMDIIAELDLMGEVMKILAGIQ